MHIASSGFSVDFSWDVYLVINFSGIATIKLGITSILKSAIVLKAAKPITAFQSGVLRHKVL